MRPLLARLLTLFGRRRLDEEFSDEMSAHLEFAAADYSAQGLSGEEARRAAAHRFGGTRQAEEAYRDGQGFPLLESIWQDTCYAIRTLRRQPAYTAVVLAVLATVIGLNTSLFTLTAGLLFRPWSGMTDPSRVVAIYPVSQNGPGAGFSLAGYRYFSEHARSLSSIAVMRTEQVDLGEGGALGKASAFLVSGNFFETLGVAAAHGRGLRSDDDRLGSPSPVAVLGFALWQSRFGGDPAIAGATVRINGVPFGVVGIAARDFVGPEPGSADLFVPVAAVSLLRPNDPSVRSLLYAPDYCCSDIVGRLAPGMTRDNARAELDVLGRSFATNASLERGQSDAAAWQIVVTGTEFLARPGRKNQILAVVGVLSTGLLLVWLLACANIGNLQIGRAAARAREIGVRLSLGASRARIVRQLVTEGLVLTMLAAAFGVAVAYVLPPVVLRLVADAGTTPFSLAPDVVVFTYALLIAAVSAMAFGLAPALHATRTDVAHALKTHDGSGHSGIRLRTFLLGVQVAISVILLVAAGLLVRGAQQRSGSFDFGFSVDDVSVVSFDVPVTYSTAQSDVLLGDLTLALEGMNGRPFGFAAREPLANSREITFIQRSASTDARGQQTQYLEASPGYFAVLRIPIVTGRGFRTNERSTATLINESLARAYWPDENPVGKTFLMEAGGGRVPREVVGVVRNAHTASLDEVPPILYGPLTHARRFPKLLLRGTGAAAAADVAKIAARIDPRVHVTTTPLSARVETRLQSSRYGAMIAAMLGGFALALAAIGTFGVFAYTVRQRTREIGIRIALGAQPPAVVRLVLIGQSRAMFWGLGIGALGAVPASMILRGFLYGLSPFDPAAYLGVAGALALAAIAASYPPARRATRIDPVVALRDE